MIVFYESDGVRFEDDVLICVAVWVRVANEKLGSYPSNEERVALMS